MKPLLKLPASAQSTAAARRVGPQLSNQSARTHASAQSTRTPASALRNNTAQPRMAGARPGAPLNQAKQVRGMSQPAATHSCQAPACHSVGAQHKVAAATPSAASALPNRLATQPRANTPQRVENRAQATLNRGAAPAPVGASAKSPSYVVHMPTVLGGGRQQIRITVRGTQQVAGSLDLNALRGGKVYISNLKVEKQHRRQGLANQLMSAAMQTARSHGFNGARLEARPSDNGITPQALVSMYQKLGFKNVGKSQRGNPLMERRL
jgi:ribosomal protein S18 acetylase RimI-like enzyme